MTMAIVNLGKCFGKRKRQSVYENTDVPSCEFSQFEDSHISLSKSTAKQSEGIKPIDTASQSSMRSISAHQSTCSTQSEQHHDCLSIDGKVAAVTPTDPPPLTTVGRDVMVSIVSFLDPRETLSLLTMPICKQWHKSYTTDQELWRTICCTEPFSADLSNKHSNGGCNVCDAASPHVVSCYDDIDDDNSFCSLNHNGNDIFGEHRLIYTSFVRCMNYLDRVNIKDGTNGHELWDMDDLDGIGHQQNLTSFPTFGVTKSLKKFLSRNKVGGLLKSVIGNGVGEISSAPIGISSDGREIRPFAKKHRKDDSPPKPKFGNSMITNRLWGPTTNGVPSHLNLPKSCAIYSIVNWMVAHPNVRGIQVMCIQSLPRLLEDEQQRQTAQRVGLVEVILCAMLRFPDCIDLHVAVFHAMVLLARPIGGREGMLYDNSMTDTTQNIGLTSPIELTDSFTLASRCGGLPSPGYDDDSSLEIGSEESWRENDHRTTGIDILLGSMKRFTASEKLQSMACWAFVNVALVPSQKNMFTRQGGIEAILEAMENHPECFDVQFRALFALINLVVPCRQSDVFGDANMDSYEATRIETAVLSRLGPRITKLSVLAMKNFCSSKEILNRGCLVIHNLSQSPEFMTTLLDTPHCYQILEWCVTNYSTDSVLRRSVSSTLHRMEIYLDEHHEEQRRFSIALERQNEEVLEQLW